MKQMKRRKRHAVKKTIKKGKVAHTWRPKKGKQRAALAPIRRRQKAQYSKTVTVKVPRSMEQVHKPKKKWTRVQKIKCKLGSQLADNFFKHLRKSILTTTKNYNSSILDGYVHSFRWRHTRWDKDIWAATAEAVQRWYGD